jgi:putative DNA primase/helicase
MNPTDYDELAAKADAFFRDAPKFGEGMDAQANTSTDYPLNVIFADQLGDTYDPPNEIVEGVLTAGDGSVVYGDSNSGKTFFVIDMGCALARGIDWLGRRTEQGIVVYLATESPGSVKGRLQAYQVHHHIKVPNFAVVQNPIDLFDGEADTRRIIKLVRQLEVELGSKVRLIIGDTLARLSAGANENSGEDMSVVVKHFDRIRAECDAHFLLVHHSGKNAAAGQRGWSGVRAAIDTEIEITEGLTGRCAEITKQRDLNSKGDRIGFRLEPVTLGQTKWGSPATSCVVMAADAPVKESKVIKLGETQQAVMALLRGAAKNMRIKEIADSLTDQGLGRTAVYNAVNRLRDVELVEVSSGMVHLIGGKS